MTTIVNTKLGETRGKRRIYLDGAKLAREGYQPGDRYDLALENARVVIKLRDDGKYMVSKRQRNGTLYPVIDITRAELAELFDGVAMVRVLIAKGKIVVTAHHQERKVAERVERLLSKVRTGEPLRVASLFHGGGVLDAGLHSGLDRVGVASKIGVAVEIESTYLNASLANNPELWDDTSIPIESPVQHVDLGRNPPQMDVLCGGVPCTGASRSGRSKNKLEHAEDHQAAGAMFFSFLEFIKVLNPAVVIGENVPEYRSSASMSVIRSVLNDLGYELQERVLNGNEFGVLEDRNRLCFVAISKGLEGVFDLDAVTPHRAKEACLDDILESFERIAEDRWKSFDYLADKAKRDEAAGKGFKRQLLTGAEASCGTVGRGYAKARSTEPFLVHPHDSSLSRLFTPREHARIKGVPETLIRGLSDTRAHEVLGQSVCFPKFEALGMALGRSLRSAAGFPQDHLLEVEVEVLDPENDGTIGGEDLDWVPATLDVLSGRLALVGEGRRQGWPMAVSQHGVEIRLQGQIIALPVIGGGPELECPGALVGVYDADHIREHGESVFTDLASVPARHVLGKGASSIAGQALSCAA